MAIRNRPADELDAIDRHLDEHVGERYKVAPLAQDWARIAKVVEEAGEAFDEFILWTEQNPRKVQRGDTSTREKVLEELADTAITAMLAITHFTKDGNETLKLVRDKLTATWARVGEFERERIRQAVR